MCFLWPVPYFFLDIFQEASPAEQEQFLKIMRHAQRGRMEDQRCSLQPSRSTPVSPTHNGNAVNKEPTGQGNTQEIIVKCVLCFGLWNATRITLQNKVPTGQRDTQALVVNHVLCFCPRVSLK